MFFEAEERPWTHHLKKPMGGLLAVSLGLLVCIADVKLPAETNRGASANRSGSLDAKRCDILRPCLGDVRGA